MSQVSDRLREDRAEDAVAPLAKANVPRGPGRITVVGILLSGATIVLGALGVHDGLSSAGILTQGSVIEPTLSNLDGSKPQWWAVPVGIIAVLLGLWLLLVALRPRPRTAVALRSESGVFLRPRDVRRLAERAADDVDGVLSTRATSTRRAASVTVAVTGNDGQIADAVRAAVQERLAPLQSPPRVKINLKAGGAP